MRAKLKKIKGVLFDFDGTVVSIHIDFRGIKDTIVRKAAEAGLSVPGKSRPILELLDYIGKNNRDNGATKDFISSMERHLVGEELKGAGKALPLKGSISLMESLRKKGFKTGIVTRNCRQAVCMVSRRHKVPYDVLLTRDDVLKVKPCREHLMDAASSLGLKKEEIILIGDHPMDIKCARVFGCLSCAILSGNIKRADFEAEGADFIFDSIEEAGYLFGIKPVRAGKLPNSLLEYLLKTYIKNDASVVEGPGIGRDCAVFETRGNLLFAKTDPVTLVGEDTGQYLVNVNVNDMAAMGGIPKWFLCSLLFPRGITFDMIEEVFCQVCSHCKKYSINWVGGHTEVSSGVKKTVACGFLAGFEGKGKNKKLKPVRKGDRVFLVKEAGIEAASIMAREKMEVLKREFPENILSRLVNSVNRPGIGVLREARLLWENFGVKVMHDPTEGGISTALYEVSLRCGTGLMIDKKKIMFYPHVERLSSLFGLNPYGIISSGCLLGIIPEEEGPGLRDFMRKRRIKCSLIGEAVDREGVYLRDGENVSPFPVFERDEITRL